MNLADTRSARATDVADWIEVECLLSGQAMSAPTLEAQGRGAGLRQADVGLGLRTMARRREVLGPAYPFRAGAGAAALRGATATPWAAWLLMSPGTATRELIDVPDAARLHETLTRHACSQIYGRATEAIRFAWPSDEGRPREFPDAVRWLGQRMRAPIGSGYRPPTHKDGGVDVVVWRPFPDGRSGFPVLLVQCTVERDYPHKASDIDTRIWSSWLALDVDPATALAVPCVVPSGETWNALASRTVVLDRIRLASLIDADPVDQSTQPGVSDWVLSTLEMVRSAR